MVDILKLDNFVVLELLEAEDNLLKVWINPEKQKSKNDGNNDLVGYSKNEITSAITFIAPTGMSCKFEDGVMTADEVRTNVIGFGNIVYIPRSVLLDLMDMSNVVIDCMDE